MQRPELSVTNPCLNDLIYWQSTIRDSWYTISYPANQLFVNVDYNQKIDGCPVSCDILLADSEESLPEPPFTTYGTEGVFSVFTSDAQYDGNTYSIAVTCHS